MSLALPEQLTICKTWQLTLVWTKGIYGHQSRLVTNMVTKADMKPTQIGQRGPVLQTSRAPYWEYDKFGQLQLLSIPNLDALIYLANLNLLCHTFMSFPRKKLIISGLPRWLSRCKKAIFVCTHIRLGNQTMSQLTKQSGACTIQTSQVGTYFEYL